jgi:hypothetical protein
MAKEQQLGLFPLGPSAVGLTPRQRAVYDAIPVGGITAYEAGRAAGFNYGPQIAFYGRQILRVLKARQLVVERRNPSRWELTRD